MKAAFPLADPSISGQLPARQTGKVPLRQKELDCITMSAPRPE